MDDSSGEVVEELIPNLIIQTLKPIISQNSRIMNQARRKGPVSPDSDGNITQQSKMDLYDKIRYLRQEVERPKQFKDHIRQRTQIVQSKLNIPSQLIITPMINLRVSLTDQDFNIVMLDQEGSHPMIQRQDSAIKPPSDNSLVKSKGAASLSPITTKQQTSARLPNCKPSTKHKYDLSNQNVSTQQARPRQSSKDSNIQSPKSKKTKQKQQQYPLLTKTTEESRTKLNSLKSKNQSQVTFLKGDNHFQFLHRIQSQDSKEYQNNHNHNSPKKIEQSTPQKQEPVRHQQRLLTASNSPKKTPNLTYSTKRDSNMKLRNKKSEKSHDSPLQQRKLDNLRFMDANLRTHQNPLSDRNRRSSALSVLSAISKASGQSTPKSILKNQMNDHQSMMSFASSNSAQSPIRSSISKKVRFQLKKKKDKVSSQL